MDELIKQAPYLAAIVIIVLAFLKAQSARDALFVQAQSEHTSAQAVRDQLFIDAIERNNKISAALVREIKEMESIIVSHDAIMRASIDAIEKDFE